MSLVSLQKSILDSLSSLSGDNKLYFRDITANAQLPKSVSIAAIIGGHELAGFGVAESKDKAAFCASMEVIERFIFHKSDFNEPFRQLGKYFSRNISFDQIADKFELDKNVFLTTKTTNGLAIHTNRKEATESAIDELIERHVILKAMASRTSPHRESLEGGKCFEFALPDGIEADFFIWQGPIDRFVVILRLESNGRTCYGFGASRSLIAAKRKAFFEASPRIGILLTENESSIQKLLLGENFKEHFSKLCPWTKSWLENSSETEIPGIDTHLNIDSVFVQKINLPTELQELKSKIFAVRAVSPYMQPLFAGNWDHGKINKLAVSNCFVLPPEMHLVS